MATTISTDRAKRTRGNRRTAPPPRYESTEPPAERRRPLPAGSAETQPRLGPYEFRYDIAFGYASPVLR